MAKFNRRMMTALLAAMILCVFTIPSSARAENLRVGSRGEQVTQVQQKLKRWGYYYGAVDGIFGEQTKRAVIHFQQKNGLAADGIVGPATAKAMGITLSGGSGGSGSNMSSDLYLLARVVYGEGRGRCV